MRIGLNHIAYERLEVCNALSMTAVEAALDSAGLRAGDRALDIGAGNAAVAIRLAERFGLMVTAVERDPRMAELAARRIANSPAAERIDLRVADSGMVLAEPGLWRLIVVIGATDAASGGEREPVAVFRRLAERLGQGGLVLWGEPFWAAEPSAPFRQIIELTNRYETHDGWQAAARAAGLDVVSARVSPEAEWLDYMSTMDAAVRDWVIANREREEAPALLARADAQMAIWQAEGRRALGFGLYLLRRPDPTIG